MGDEWREGPARSMDPIDQCPLCSKVGQCVFASDFKLMGKHSIRACAACGKVSDNGHEKGLLVVYERKEA